jgi:D-glycero-alpha-D-manno-heptose-7-phosphate kinase
MPPAALAGDVFENPPRSLRVQAAASARAPMRVSLAGGGTDIPPFAQGIGGRVVGASIGLYVRATVTPFDPGWIRLEGFWGMADLPASIEDSWPPSLRDLFVEQWGSGQPLTAGSPPRSATFTRRAAEPPSNDVEFRMLEAARAALGVQDGVHIFVESDLTPGTGLGGSAAAAVALLAAFYSAGGASVQPQRLATEASFLEREVLGLRCGLQDQLCAAVGGILDLRFHDDGFDVGPMAAPASLMEELTAGLLLIDTRIRRVSGEVLSGAQNGHSPDHHVELVAAAEDTAQGFRLGSLQHVLEGMRRSADAKLRRGGPSALPGDLVRKLSGLGATVVRACGAGGGGHLLVWAEPSRHAAIIRAVGPCIVRRPELGVPGVTI